MNTKFLLRFFIMMCIGYLSISFIIWDINPSHWTASTRFLYLYFFPLLSTLILFLSQLLKND